MYERDHQMQDWCQFHRPKYKSRKLQEFGTENNNSRHSSPRHCQEPLTLWHPSEFLAKRSVGVTPNNNSASVLTPSRQNFGPTTVLSGRREHVASVENRWSSGYLNPTRQQNPHLWTQHSGQHCFTKDHGRLWVLQNRVRTPFPEFSIRNQVDLENCFEFPRTAMPGFALTLMMDID